LCLFIVFFLFYCVRAHRYLHSFPTRRSSDLPDCAFLSFTNGTLIDEAFCKEMLRVKNFVPAISLEGFEQANDGRRGNGVFEKVIDRKSTRLNSSHVSISYAVFCLKKKNIRVH